MATSTTTKKSRKTIDMTPAPDDTKPVGYLTRAAKSATKKKGRDLEIDEVPVVVPEPEPEPVVPEVLAPQTEEQRAERVVEDRVAAESAGFKVAATIYREGQAVIQDGVDNAVKSRQQWEALPTVTSAMGQLKIRVESEDRRDQIVSMMACDYRVDGALTATTGIDGERETFAPISKPVFCDIASLAEYGFGTTYLLKSCSPELRAINVNAQLKSKDEGKTLRLRTRNREVGEGREIFAAVSEAYTAVDVDKMVPLLLAAMPETARADVTYQRDQSRGLVDVLFHSDVRAEDYACGEIFKAGIRVKWDDAGHGAIKVDAIIWRNLCLNLIIVDSAVVNVGKVIHIGALEKKIGQLKLAFEKANDALAHFTKAWGHAKKEVLVPKVIELKRSKILKDENQPIAKPFDACTVDEKIEGFVNGMVLTGTMTTVTKKDVEGIVTSYWKDSVTGTKDVTRAGVVNAVSRWAHEGMDRWSGDALERAAGLLTWQSDTSAAFQYAYVANAA